ncbi:MAG TPA: DUF6300 family protein [Streptomyces sp.]|nr:DUF6300 family protein [Streptomyces sp.]
MPGLRHRRRRPPGGRPAAGLFVQWFADGGGHDESRVQEGAHLLMERTKECMAAHGWHLQDAPPDQP